MYMRFRMQIESVMKEVTFWAEPRAQKSRAGPRGAGGAGECEAPHGTGAEGWTRMWCGRGQGAGVPGGGIAYCSFGSGRDLGLAQFSHFSQMWKLRSRAARVSANDAGRTRARSLWLDSQSVLALRALSVESGSVLGFNLCHQ